MKIPVDVWLRGTDFAQTTSFEGALQGYSYTGAASMSAPLYTHSSWSIPSGLLR